MQRLVLRDRRRSRWLSFAEPVAVLEARALDEVAGVLAEAERRVNDEGLTAAGFVSYEAAPAFDAALVTRPPGQFPLARFGLYAGAAVIPSPQAGAGDAPHREWRIDTAKGDYLRNIESIRAAIARGDTYQVNYTIRAQAGHIGDPWTLFLHMALDAPYAAYIDAGEYAIVSASPELFFRLDGQEISCQPMKGTAARGLDSEHDADMRRGLLTSAKDRAENVMIADMTRNDLGRIAEPGSVVTGRLCQIEKYATVWQMTSTVTARTRATVSEIFAALFPCASITGAPKVASMRLLAELEASPRDIYTGAIGWIAPGRHAQFSVAIRTALAGRTADNAVYGIGGGIVWDSAGDNEYDECLSKSRILYRAPRPAAFRLLETMLWTGSDGWFLYDRHLRRLQASADYFDFPFDRSVADARLGELASGLDGPRHRVRLLLDCEGRFEITVSAAGPPPSTPQRLRLAAAPVDAGDVFLYHKTTRRDVYERALAAAGDCDDVLLWNTDGYLTESCRANLIVRCGEDLFTPPVECGLLAGTCREWLLDAGTVTERSLRVADLHDADEIRLANSVRGLYPAILETPPAEAAGGVGTARPGPP